MLWRIFFHSITTLYAVQFFYLYYHLVSNLYYIRSIIIDTVTLLSADDTTLAKGFYPSPDNMSNIIDKLEKEVQKRFADNNLVTNNFKIQKIIFKVNCKKIFLIIADIMRQHVLCF